MKWDNLKQYYLIYNLKIHIVDFFGLLFRKLVDFKLYHFYHFIQVSAITQKLTILRMIMHLLKECIFKMIVLIYI